MTAHERSEWLPELILNDPAFAGESKDYVMVQYSCGNPPSQRFGEMLNFASAQSLFAGKIGMRILAVDWGEKRIGLAVGDTSHGVAMPLDTVSGGSAAIDIVAERAKKEGARFILLGLPLTLSGEEGPMVEHIKRIAVALGKKAGVPVFFRDERFTSAAVSRYNVPKGRRDALVATMLLGEYFEEMGTAAKDSEKMPR